MAAVVINEFEVLAEPRTTGRAAEPAGGADAGAAAPAVTAQDLRVALEQMHAQTLRVWAH